MIMDPDAINRAIDAALATLPPDAKGAIIAQAEVKDGVAGVTIAAYAKVDDHFSFEAHIHWSPADAFEAGAEVRYVF
jgi:hypothetical protein